MTKLTLESVEYNTCPHLAVLERRGWQANFRHDSAIMGEMTETGTLRNVVLRIQLLGGALCPSRFVAR